ncbi:hypothetical protein [Paraclostridium sordellii]|nr:hypothetical protein [Paeniclostridium sordellii]CEQ14860.1 Uncharacterised protein [[Clostridium] sordellii] [Paeniclostridium sordellii]
MSKHNCKFRLKVVKSYSNGDDGYKLIAKQYGIYIYVQDKR